MGALKPVSLNACLYFLRSGQVFEKIFDWAIILTKKADLFNVYIDKIGFECFFRKVKKKSKKVVKKRQKN